MFEKIYIELSDICGLKCDFCPSKKSKRKIMDIDKFSFLAKNINKKAKIFTFHILGDPFILPNLIAYLKIAQENFMKIELTTSGFYFENKDFILEFKNIHQINISLMSFLSQNNISFENYFKNIDTFLQKHQSLKHKAFINFRLWNLDKDFNPPKENNLFYDFFTNKFKIKFDKKEPKIRLSRHIILNQKRAFKWPSLNDDFISSSGTCHALTKQIGILSDGTLVPCCLDSNACINLGNVFEKDFDELLKSEKINQIKKGFKENKLIENLCQGCEFNTN